MKLEYSLIPQTKINLKLIKYLNIRPDTIKLLQKNIGRTVFDINHSNIFLDEFLNSNGNKSKNKQIEPNNLKSFYTVKETISKMKR